MGAISETTLKRVSLAGHLALRVVRACAIANRTTISRVIVPCPRDFANLTAQFSNFTMPEFSVQRWHWDRYQNCLSGRQSGQNSKCVVAFLNKCLRPK